MNKENDQVVIRNKVSGMMKHGRWRALRNMPVGWLSQSLHSTDSSERYFRIIVEVLVFIIAVNVLSWGSNFVEKFFLVGIAVHSVFWLLFGSFWVYMLDSFDWVENGGIYNVIDYVDLTKKALNMVDCTDAVLIYGSMSRSKFHNGSDLDLRILKRQDSNLGLVSLPLSALLKAYSFFIKVPVDYQVVDSMEFLSGQMRADELPIIISVSDRVDIESSEFSYEQIKANPNIILRDAN